MISLISGYLIVINLCGLLAMKSDKRRAKEGNWRIPEKTLFLLAVLGGSLGCLFGMFHYRHKTRRLLFRIGLPVIFFGETALLFFLAQTFYFH